MAVSVGAKVAPGLGKGTASLVGVLSVIVGINVEPVLGEQPIRVAAKKRTVIVNWMG
jgi:hypothetical protein